MSAPTPGPIRLVERALACRTPELGPDAGVLLLRVTAGLMLIGHGLQKLFGILSGDGLTGTTKFFASLGYQPAEVFAVVGGCTELVGGALLTLGLFTPLATTMVVAMMTNAVIADIVIIGFWSQFAGAEYPMVLALAAIAVAGTGPRRYSLDRSRGWANGGIRPMLVTAALGLGGAGTVLLFTGPLVQLW